MAELRERVTDYLGWAVPTSDGHKLVKDLWVELSTRTAPAKGEAELDNDNGLYSLALAVVDYFTNADPHVQVEAGKCALREAQDALDGFAKGAVPRQPVPSTLGKGNAEGTAPSAPTPEPAKHTEDCDRVKGFSRNCSCAPTPGDRVTCRFCGGDTPAPADGEGKSRMVKGATLALRVLFGYEPDLASELMPSSAEQQAPEDLERTAERLVHAALAEKEGE